MASYQVGRFDDSDVVVNSATREKLSFKESEDKKADEETKKSWMVNYSMIIGVLYSILLEKIPAKDGEYLLIAVWLPILN